MADSKKEKHKYVIKWTNQKKYENKCVHKTEIKIIPNSSSNNNHNY